MHLLTFSVLKNYKLKSLLAYHLSKRFNSDILKTQVTAEKPAEDENLVEIAESWGASQHADLRAAVLLDMRVVPDFVSQREEDAMITELEPVLRRMRYEFDHWDDAIHGYRETERARWTTESECVLSRVRALAFPPHATPPGGEPLPHAHVLDLAPSGHIKPHVDAVRFCGDVIAGVCLLSAAVMRLQHAQHQHLALHALLPRRALYIMRGAARYQFTHAVLGGEASVWRGERVPRARRIAVIVRSRPQPAPHLPDEPSRVMPH